VRAKYSSQSLVQFVPCQGLTLVFLNTLSNLSAYPLLGKIPNEEDLANMGYRFLVVQNYLIFYTVEDHIIWVHRIIHGARDYLSLL